MHARACMLVSEHSVVTSINNQSMDLAANYSATLQLISEALSYINTRRSLYNQALLIERGRNKTDAFPLNYSLCLIFLQLLLFLMDSPDDPLPRISRAVICDGKSGV